MKVLIIEDEINAALRLKSILNKISQPIEIIEICESIRSSLIWFSKNPIPDLIFLDIQLSDGISFEIFKHIEINCPIVFVTAFDEYSIDAFKLNSLDYLLKPYTLEQVNRTIMKLSRINKYHQEKFDEVFFNKLSQSINPNYKSRFYAKKNESLRTIPVENILVFSHDYNTTTLIDIHLEKFVISYSLDSLEKRLDPKFFFRINRNYIIHIDSISTMNITHKSRITVYLKNNIEEIVSRGKTKAFKLWLDA